MAACASCISKDRGVDVYLNAGKITGADYPFSVYCGICFSGGLSDLACFAMRKCVGAGERNIAGNGSPFCDDPVVECF